MNYPFYQIIYLVLSFFKDTFSSYQPAHFTHPTNLDSDLIASDPVELFGLGI